MLTIKNIRLRVIYLIGLLLLFGAVSYQTADAQPSCTSTDDVAGAIDSNNTDVDDDDDGLIEICRLEGLNAIRQQLDGSGYGSSDDTTGCKTGGCNGYELTTDLDFSSAASYKSISNRTAYYSDSDGWQPIGNAANSFTARFNGNGYTIKNLKINLSTSYNNVGLFGYISNASVRNIGLLDVSINNANGNSTGGLVGTAEGSSKILNSYTTGSISGRNEIGGLVGFLDGSSEMNNTYANASVRGNGAGGLLGVNGVNAKILNSYTISRVSGNNFGLVVGRRGIRDGRGAGTFSNVIYQNRAFAPSAGNSDCCSAGGVLSESAIKNLTGYMGWSTRNWHFGTSSQYPALRYNYDGCTTLSDICYALLKGQTGSGYKRDTTELLNLELNDRGSPVSFTPSFNKNTTEYRTAILGSNSDSVGLTVGALLTAHSSLIEIEHAISSLVFYDSNRGFHIGNYSVNLGPAGTDTIVRTKLTLRLEGTQVTSKTYTITIPRAGASNRLKSLGVKSGTAEVVEDNFLQDFAASVTTYNVPVPYTVHSINLEWEAEDSDATVQIIEQRVVGGSQVSIGDTGTVTTIVIRVTPVGGGESQDYTVNISRGSDPNANLESLTLHDMSGGEIELRDTNDQPVDFSTSTLEYIAAVNSDVTTMTIVATAENSHAMIEIAGATVAGGEPHVVVFRENDMITPVEIVVQPQDTAVAPRTYTIRIRDWRNDTRLKTIEISDNDFNKTVPVLDTKNQVYKGEIDSEAAQLYISALEAEDFNALGIVVYDGTSLDTQILSVDGHKLADGIVSDPIEINSDREALTIVVTAEDGSTENHLVSLSRPPSRNANLANLSLRDMSKQLIELRDENNNEVSFSTNSLVYTVAVSSNVSTMTTVATAESRYATITVAGVPVDSGDTHIVAFRNNGMLTPVEVVVTPEDPTADEKTYIVNIRDTSNTALKPIIKISPRSLGDIVYDDIELVYTTADRVYRGEVEKNVDSMQFKELASDSIYAEINVWVGNTSDGVPLLTNENLGQLIPLQGLTTTFTIVVTAEDGSEGEPYYAVISKNLSSNANLRSMQLHDKNGIIKLRPSFLPTINKYDAAIDSDVTTTTLLLTLEHDGAAVIVDGKDINIFDPAALVFTFANDANKVTTSTLFTIKIAVQPENPNAASQTYTINIRDKDNNAELKNIGISSTDDIQNIELDYDSDSRKYTRMLDGEQTRINITELKATSKYAQKIEVAVKGGTQFIVNEDGRLPIGPIDIAPNEPTTMTIVVTAEDGTVGLPYHVELSRPASGNANLASLTLTDTDDTEIEIRDDDNNVVQFSASELVYNAAVSSDLSVMTVAATAQHRYAKITVTSGGTEATNNGDSYTVTFRNDEGLITPVQITVTPEDGSSGEIYTINIRDGDNAELKTVAISPADNTEQMISLSYDSTSRTYRGVVDSTITQIRVTKLEATSAYARQIQVWEGGMADGTLILTVNGYKLADNTTSDAVAVSLAEPTTLTIVVTAEDGSEGESYSVELTQELGIKIRAKVFLEGPLE